MARRVVILGAGYGGVKCALELEKRSHNEETEVILVNKHDYHQFMALLHESAVGKIRNRDIRVPLREIFARDRVRIIKDVVRQIVPGDNRVIMEEANLDYDYLVVGLGSEPEYFDIPGLEQHSFTLRSLNSARLIKTHIENNFAEYKAFPRRPALLTVVVGGAGFTGIEIAGELADWLPQLAEQYDVPANLVSVVNIESASTILKGCDRHLIENAYSVLRAKGVQIITGVDVVNVTHDAVRLGNGETIRTATFIWAGGIRANRVIARSGFATSVRGRATVNKYLQSVNYPNVYMVGDNAFITEPDGGKVMGPTAQVAIQSGILAARNILADIRGEDLQVFRPRELGRVVSLGRKAAVGEIGRSYRVTGRIAGLLKEAIQWKYLFSIGGFRLVAKKFLE